MAMSKGTIWRRTFGLVVLVVWSSNGNSLSLLWSRRSSSTRLFSVDKPQSAWTGTRNLNEVFFKTEMEKLEKEFAEEDRRKSIEAQSLLGTSESTTRRDFMFTSQERESGDQNGTSSSTVGANVSSSRGRLPFLEFDSIGLTGRWVERSGNFVLRPQASGSGGSGVKPAPPLGVIHFLGGAFVGAAPHLTYRYLLESLAEAGYVVVATPYRLDFGSSTFSIWRSSNIF